MGKVYRMHSYLLDSELSSTQDSKKFGSGKMEVDFAVHQRCTSKLYQTHRSGRIGRVPAKEATLSRACVRDNGRVKCELDML